MSKNFVLSGPVFVTVQVSMVKNEKQPHAYLMHILYNILSKSTAFWRIWRSAFFRTSPHVDCRGQSRTAATTKMELFDQVSLRLGSFERKPIAFIAEARALHDL